MGEESRWRKNRPGPDLLAVPPEAHVHLGAAGGPGVDVFTVQELAGHANASTTAAYDRRSETVRREAVRRVRRVRVPG